MTMRIFEDKPAIREMTPLLLALSGASGCGKTYSSLRLATGIQTITGGEIYYIDTEARRALHYSDKFTFRHIDFKAPFGPMDYLQAIEHCAKKGARIIVIDSLSHEHEGPGGVLEMHETELDRLSANNPGKRDNYNFLAWQKPKSERRRLINTILQMPINFIFCFRAKEKIKLPSKKDKAEGQSGAIALGWMPIAGEEYIYETTIHCLLYPGSDGIPTWVPNEIGEKAMIKLPQQFRELFKKPYTQLTEEVGAMLANWATGGKKLPDNWHEAQGKTTASLYAKAEPLTGADHSEPCATCKNNPPRCVDPKCNLVMLFWKSGIKRASGEVYDAYWQCPKKCKNPKDGRKNSAHKAVEWHAIIEGTPLDSTPQ